ncbi:Cysteine-rich secretory protein LCCL [Mactra antiquata]
MDVYFLLTVLTLSVSVTDGLLRDISGYKDFITIIHNFYRSYEKAADMKEITWDPYLQKRAEQWSENCYWDHQREGHGENLAYFWTNGHAEMTTMEVILKSSQNWWKEVNDWSWSRDCGQACHYTQMIWGSTERIGCALSKCGNLRTDSGRNYNDADFFVCFYDPPGNFVGKYPYTLGESCSKCSTGEVCNKGLCSKPKSYHAQTTTIPTAYPTTTSSSILDKIRIQKNQNGASATYVQQINGESEHNRLTSSRTKPRQSTFIRRVIYRWVI